MAAGKAHAGPILAEQILHDCNQYSVPNDGEGTLRDSGRVEAIGQDYAATWNTVYAAFQFYGMWPDGSHVIKHHTQGYARAPSIMWTESAKRAYGKKWETVAKREYVKGAKG
jgi:hypothetical protein